jgi:WD40 repeat protein
MRTLLTAVLFVACSSHETRTSDDRPMSNSSSHLEVIESVADMAGMDVAISPVDARTWATRTAEVMHLRAGDNPVDVKQAGSGRGIRFTPDGKQLIAGLSVFETATGEWAQAPGSGMSFRAGLSRQGAQEAIGYIEDVSAACFDPPITVVAAQWRVPRNGAVKKRTEAPGLRLIAFDEQRNHVADLTPDLGDTGLFTAVDCSKRWVVATAPRAIVWDRANGYKRLTPTDVELPAGTAVSIASDDSAFAVVGGTLDPEGSVTVIDPAASKTIARADTGLGTLFSVAFSPDGKRIAAGADGGVAVLSFEGANLKLLATAKVEGLITGVAFEPDGKAVRAVGARGAHRLVLR